MDELDREELVDLDRVVAAAVQVVSHHCFDRVPLQKRTAQSRRIEQDLLYEIRQRGAVPEAKVRELMSAEDETRRAEPSECAVDRCGPVRHAIVAEILGLDLGFAQ